MSETGCRLWGICVGPPGCATSSSTPRHPDFPRLAKFILPIESRRRQHAPSILFLFDTSIGGWTRATSGEGSGSAIPNSCPVHTSHTRRRPGSKGGLPHDQLQVVPTSQSGKGPSVTSSPLEPAVPRRVSSFAHAVGRLTGCGKDAATFRFTQRRGEDDKIELLGTQKNPTFGQSGCLRFSYRLILRTAQRLCRSHAGPGTKVLPHRTASTAANKSRDRRPLRNIP
jgi:hypothetical protein